MVGMAGVLDSARFRTDVTELPQERWGPQGIDAVVMPMGVKAEVYPEVLKALFKLTNIRGALVTMPHKVTTVALVDECSIAVQIAGSCNAILRRPDGTLLGDMFDGQGFTRGLKRKGFGFDGASCLVVGTGGVGSAIAASLAGMVSRQSRRIASASLLRPSAT